MQGLTLSVENSTGPVRIYTFLVTWFTVAIMKKVLSVGEGRKLKRAQAVVPRVAAFEDAMKAKSDEQLRDQTRLFRERLENGEDLDDLLPEAFATVREAASRVLGQRHYDVQIMGGASLHFGWVAEMKTGEGKTLVSTLAAYLNALADKGVHIVTTNDYLAQRDATWMGQVHKFLGLTVGIVLSGIDDPAAKHEAYACDITYGTNNEFGFDYLRDNMATSKAEQAQRGHSFAIVDEVDSILIDEARTPLIISGPANEAGDLYVQFAQIVKGLVDVRDYEVDEAKFTVLPTEEGIERVEEALGIDNMYEHVHQNFVHQLNTAIKAKELYKKGVDYIIADGEVKIVDEFTGRILEGRRWSDGIHQAVEAKEGVSIQEENQTLATVTLQNYFKLYDKISGMTGTGITEAGEFMHTYGLEVVAIPTNRPAARADRADSIYKSEAGKFNAVVKDLMERHDSGQPVLVGTVSVEKSERLSRMLTKAGVKHNVLNAKEHTKEGPVIAQAGRLGAITVATNMAGRGVDILWGEIQKVLPLKNLQPTEKLLNQIRMNSQRFKQRLQHHANVKVTKFANLAACMFWVRNATNLVESTTSCVDVLVVKATSVKVDSTYPLKMISCDCSPTTHWIGSSTKVSLKTYRLKSRWFPRPSSAHSRAWKVATSKSVKMF